MIIYKTLDEIKKIKKANEIIARLFEDVLPKYVKAGISTYELDQIAEDYILQLLMLLEKLMKLLKN